MSRNCFSRKMVLLANQTIALCVCVVFMVYYDFALCLSLAWLSSLLLRIRFHRFSFSFNCNGYTIFLCGFDTIEDGSWLILDYSWKHMISIGLKSLDSRCIVARSPQTVLSIVWPIWVSKCYLCEGRFMIIIRHVSFVWNVKKRRNKQKKLSYFVHNWHNVNNSCRSVRITSPLTFTQFTWKHRGEFPCKRRHIVLFKFSTRCKFNTIVANCDHNLIVALFFFFLLLLLVHLKFNSNWLSVGARSITRR